MDGGGEQPGRSVYEFFKVGDWRGRRKAKTSMLAHTVQVNLRYDKADLSQILLYVKAHDLERQGRYDSRNSPSQHLDARLAQRRMPEGIVRDVQPRIRRKTASLMSVVLLPGYDWDTFVDELAALERAALGNSVYGRRRREPMT